MIKKRDEHAFDFKSEICFRCGKIASGFDREGWKCLEYPECKSLKNSTYGKTVQITGEVVELKACNEALPK